MALSPIVGLWDGPSVTVSELMGSPLIIPTKMKEMIAGAYLSEALFRNAGGNTNGMVQFSEGDPSFLDVDIDVVSEFGEIPIGSGSRGMARIATAMKFGKGVRVSKEMIDENKIDHLNTQMKQLRNTFARFDARSAKALLDAKVPAEAVGTAWNEPGSNPWTDVADAIDTISNAAPDAALGGSDDEGYEFSPDTIVINPGLYATLAANAELAKMFTGNLADQNMLYTGQMPNTILGLTVLTSKTWPRDRVLVLERGTIGGKSDTRPLQFTPMYPEGNGPNGGPRETFRSDGTEKTVRFVDQPKAGLWLTGIAA